MPSRRYSLSPMAPTVNVTYCTHTDSNNQSLKTCGPRCSRWASRSADELLRLINKRTIILRRIRMRRCISGAALPSQRTTIARCDRFTEQDPSWGCPAPGCLDASSQCRREPPAEVIPELRANEYGAHVCLPERYETDHEDKSIGPGKTRLCSNCETWRYNRSLTKPCFSCCRFPTRSHPEESHLPQPGCHICK